MTVRHRLGRADVDVRRLRAELSAALGVSVHLLVRRPTPDDPDGDLQLEDAAGARLDVDPAVVAAVLAAHAPARTSARQALDEFDGAETPAERLGALRGWLARAVAVEQAHTAGVAALHAAVRAEQRQEEAR